MKYLGNIRYLEKKTEDYRAGRLKLAEHELIGELGIMQIKRNEGKLKKKFGFWIYFWIVFSLL